MGHHHTHHRSHPLVTLALSAAAGGLAYCYGRKKMAAHQHPPDDGPGRLRRAGPRFGDFAVVGRAVTINRPRRELFQFWRDFDNLPRFMQNVEKIQPTGGNRAVWTIRAPAGRSVEIETEIVEERPDQLIAWRSVEGSDIETEGRVTFRDAADGRGTVVEAIVAYVPPAGEFGRWMAKVFQREPAIQGRRELKRFKMLMEAGEIASSHPRYHTG